MGFQAPGTLGRSLLEGAESVKLFGEEVAVKAQIVNFKGLSSHADRNHLLEWAQSFENPAHFFIVHGDREVAPYFADSLKHLGLSAHAPRKFSTASCKASSVIRSAVMTAARSETTRKAQGFPSTRKAPCWERTSQGNRGSE